MERLIAIGDIHGFGQKLFELLQKVKPISTDTFIFLGDYIDRGPEIPWVFEQIFELKTKVKEVVLIRGNHEQWMLDAQKEPRAMSWVEIGGLNTIAAYHLETATLIEQLKGSCEFPHRIKLPLDNFFQAIPEHHFALIEQTLLFYETDAFIFVHAGFDPEKSLENQYPHILLMKTSFLLYENGGYRGTKTAVFGHKGTPGLREDKQPLPFQPNNLNLIGLDTGVHYTGVLTAMDLLSKEFWQTEPFPELV